MGEKFKLRVVIPKPKTTIPEPKTIVPKPKTRRIRVCTIHDGNKNDPIHCTLSETSLDKPLAYRCLSYVWGSPDADEVITLDGKEHAVTRNLYDVLKRLRASECRSNVWIDALCIQQKPDKNEDKRVQVAMMGEIYTKAYEVLIWLGPGSARSAVTAASASRLRPIDALDQVREILKLLDKDVHFHELPINVRCRARTTTCPSANKPTNATAYDWEFVLKTLQRWFNSAWFERAWTVKEVVLAGRATLWLGAECLEWDTASKAWVNFGRHMRTCCSECIGSLPEGHSKALNDMACPVIDLAYAKEALAGGQHILQPLLQFNWKLATKPQDKLFGLLGLQTTANPTPVVPDYGLPMNELLSRFARDLIVSQEWLVPLCLSLVQEVEGLPSWVPDWTVRRTHPAAYDIVRYGWSYSYCAATGFPGNTWIGADYALVVRAVRVDNIARISSAYELTDSFRDQLDTLDVWLRFMDLPSRNKERYGIGGDLEEAFWRTMFADRFHENEDVRCASPLDIERLREFMETARHDLDVYGEDALVPLNEAMASHVIAVLDRKLFQTRKGLIGVCPKAAMLGDEVFVLSDCPAPVVLRRIRGRTFESPYIAIGHYYVHGIMQGEAT